jgi:hypothetical protein
VCGAATARWRRRPWRAPICLLHRPCSPPTTLGSRGATGGSWPAAAEQIHEQPWSVTLSLYVVASIWILWPVLDPSIWISWDWAEVEVLARDSFFFCSPVLKYDRRDLYVLWGSIPIWLHSQRPVVNCTTPCLCFRIVSIIPLGLQDILEHRKFRTR